MSVLRAIALLVCMMPTAAAAQELVEIATGGVVRVLDRVSGALNDFALATGASAETGHIAVTMGECRYPAEDPSSDAYAYLNVRDPRDGKVYFQGWMIASSPALNALDHPRYDVWVLRCINS